MTERTFAALENIFYTNSRKFLKKADFKMETCQYFLSALADSFTSLNKKYKNF